jgi:hypothetical protein
MFYGWFDRLQKVVSPRSGEKSKDFISRCMAAEANAFPDVAQRRAVCQSKLERARKGAVSEEATPRWEGFLARRFFTRGQNGDH